MMRNTVFVFVMVATLSACAKEAPAPNNPGPVEIIECQPGEVCQ